VSNPKRWMKHAAYIDEMKNEYNNLGGKPLGK
jgi:hypothetical protein